MRVQVLRIQESHLQQLLEHASRCWPHEAVAFLLGIVRGTVATVLQAHPVENVAGSPSLFEVDPHTHYRLLLDAEERGLEVVGIFHSHPSDPTPSPLDIQNMRFNSVPWLISGRSKGEWSLRCFTLAQGTTGRMTEVRLEVL